MSETAALRAQRVTPAIFVKIDLSGGALRLWSGVNDRRGGPGDEAGSPQPLYLGRRLINFPALVQLSNAKAHRTSIDLSGANGALADLLDGRADEIPGAAVGISFAIMSGAVKHPDVTWPLWKVNYIADTVAFAYDDGLKPIISISAATATSRRKRPANAFWTMQDQFRLHSGDYALDRIASLNEGVTKVFKGT